MTVAMNSFLIGLIGSGIDGSLTPSMHEREGDRQGFRYMYKRIDIDRLGLDLSALPELLVAAEQMGFTGLNITHPCKQEVIRYLDELSDEASRIGAVNTVLFKKGRRIGYNTDGRAFVSSFQSSLRDVPHDSIVLMGAGGAGTAIAHSMLNSMSTSLVVIDEDLARAEALALKLVDIYGPGKARTAESLESAIGNANGFINATPVGMEHCPGSVLPQSMMRTDLWIADIVYFPLETAFLAHARKLGCRLLPGSGMAIFQAVRAFELFTGLKADPERMRATFESFDKGAAA